MGYRFRKKRRQLKEKVFNIYNRLFSPSIRAKISIAFLEKSALKHEERGEYHEAGLKLDESYRKARFNIRNNPQLTSRLRQKHTRANVFEICELMFGEKKGATNQDIGKKLQTLVTSSSLAEPHSAFANVLDRKMSFSSFLKKFYPDAHAEYGSRIKQYAEKNGQEYRFSRHKCKLV